MRSVTFHYGSLRRLTYLPSKNLRGQRTVQNAGEVSPILTNSRQETGITQRRALPTMSPRGLTPRGLSSSSCQADFFLPLLTSAQPLDVSLSHSPDKVLGLEFLPWGSAVGKAKTPWTQEGWNESQGQGSKGLGAQPTYSILLRTFQSPVTWMKESEIEKCRPWLGRSFRAEPSSLQL